VSVRAYSTDHERIQQDLTRAHLVLVPSRSEGFGLVGLEAITHGTPALISSRSGIGMLLRETLPPALAARVVITMSLDEELDITRWGLHVAAILRDPVAAFATADAIRQTMAHQRTWAMAVQGMLGCLS
jgi:glycosyltransferase involved in cell wall biosynthesis